MKEKEVTAELADILSYMSDILHIQYPTKYLTTAHLLTAILDNKTCHAYELLDIFVMTKHIDDLKNIYLNHLQKISENSAQPFEDSGYFDEEMTAIFEEAENEQHKLSSQLLGSEHVLLAILNEENKHTQLIEVFKNIGVDYNIVLSKCSRNPNKSNKINQKVQNSNNLSIMTNKAIGIPSSKQSYIDIYTANINQLSREGKIDALVGRKDEINKLIEIIARRKKNNAILVGNGGCGKTHIIYGLANMIEKGTVPEIIQNKEILMLDIISLVSGTHFRGMFEERVNGLFDELKKNNKYILFIDDMHNVFKSTSKEKDTDISSMISDILTNGDIQIIGATTFKEYRNTIEINTSISRKLQKIVIESPTVEETIEILQNNKQYYEDFHNVKYTDEAIKKAAELAKRYITDRSLPDSAFDLIDLSGAHTCLVNRYPEQILDLKKQLIEAKGEKEESLNHGEFEKVDEIEKKINNINQQLADFKRQYESHLSDYSITITADDIAKAVSEITNVPVQKLTVNEKKQLANIEDVLKQTVIGQDEAIDSICKIVKRNKVGLGNKNKTQGNVLLLGPSGVGKCVCGDTKIRIRNKKTLQVQEITIKEFYNLLTK